jgi:ACS family hexuronate transporter-like MFS transporter
VGAIAAPVLVPALAASYGWQSAFITTGLFGFVWLIAWGGFHRRLARRPSKISPGLEKVEPSATPSTRISWRVLLNYRQLWSFALARILVDPIWYFYLFWLPKYLAQAHNIRAERCDAVPEYDLCVLGVGCVAGGYCSSALIKRGWTVNAARKTVMWVLVAIMSPILLVAERSGSVGVTMLLIGIAVGAHQALSTHLFTLASDLFPSRITGTVVGFGSSLSALASIVTAELIGRVLQNNPNAYSMFFVVAACLYPVAMLVIQALSPRLTPAQTPG